VAEAWTQIYMSAITICERYPKPALSLSSSTRVSLSTICVRRLNLQMTTSMSSVPALTREVKRLVFFPQHVSVTI